MGKSGGGARRPSASVRERKSGAAKAQSLEQSAAIASMQAHLATLSNPGPGYPHYNAAKSELARYRRGDLTAPTPRSAPAKETAEAEIRRHLTDMLRTEAWLDHGAGKTASAAARASAREQMAKSYQAHRSAIGNSSRQQEATRQANAERARQRQIAAVERQQVRDFAQLRRDNKSNQPFNDVLAGKPVVMRTPSGNAVVVSVRGVKPDGTLTTQQTFLTPSKDNSASRFSTARAVLDGLARGQYVRTLPSDWQPSTPTRSSRLGKALGEYDAAAKAAHRAMVDRTFAESRLAKATRERQGEAAMSRERAALADAQTRFDQAQARMRELENVVLPSGAASISQSSTSRATKSRAKTSA